MSYHSWQNKAPSQEYAENMARMFGEKAAPYCPACGRLPSWCECATVVANLEAMITLLDENG